MKGPGERALSKNSIARRLTASSDRRKDAGINPECYPDPKTEEVRPLSVTSRTNPVARAAHTSKNL